MSRRGTREIRLATRNSDLALRQAGEVKSALEDRRFDVELVEVETRGDRIRDELIHRLGKTGAFVRSLDRKVLDGDVDGAVHSMKDMPTDQPEDLIVGAIPERTSAGDALVTPDGTNFDELPADATVGTASLRRKAQALSKRPSLSVEALRGNVDTRIEKLLAPTLQREHQDRTEREAQRASNGSSGQRPQDADKERKGQAGDEEYEPEYDRTVEEWFEDLSEIERRALERDVGTPSDESDDASGVEYDAIVLAQAGLERSGLAHHVAYQELPNDEFVPAPGQGALAVTTRDDEVAEAIHDALDHPRTRVETTVERTILAELGGGCVAPLGVHALIQGEHVHVDVQVFSQDGEERIATTRDVPVESHVTGAKQVAAELADRGAAELIAAARDDDAPERAKREDE